MRNLILNKLKDVERKNDVKILFAAESGSRAWGIASRDSDYDPRFIYVHSKDYYLSVDEGRDVIELAINDELDISGWELRKALRLLAKSNASVFEWIDSPIIYQKDDEFFHSFAELIPYYFNVRAVFNHYSSMARSAMAEVKESGDNVRLKKYFYALRALLSSEWILLKNSMPPVEFGKLRYLMPADINMIVEDLMDMKRVTDESFAISPIAKLDSWMNDMKVKFDIYKPGDDLKSKDKAPLNDLFKRSII